MQFPTCYQPEASLLTLLLGRSFHQADSAKLLDTLLQLAAATHTVKFDDNLSLPN